MSQRTHFAVSARHRAGLVVAGVLLSSAGASTVMPRTQALASSTITVAAAADTYTASTDPSTNFSGSTVLKAYGNPVRNAFVRFVVPPSTPRAGVVQLSVRMETSGTAFAVRQVTADPGTWSPNTTTWKNQPAFTAPIATHGPFSQNQWAAVDVTSWVTGPGTYDFALTTASGKEPKIDSREMGTTKAPQLVITPSITGVPSPSPSASATATPAPSATATPTPSATATPTAVPSPLPTVAPIATPTASAHPGLPIYQFTGTPAVTNRYVSGGIVLISWSDLEPKEGQYNWALIDSAVTAWSSHGKKAAIRIQTMVPKSGQPPATPSWVFADGVPAVNDGITTAPVYWNPTYLAKLTVLASDVAARYDGNPSVAWFQGGVGVYGETKVDTEQNAVLSTAQTLALWRAQGYTDALWFTTIQKIVTIWHTSFVHTPLAVSVNRSFIGGTSAYSSTTVVDWLRGYGVMPQHDGIRSNTTPFSDANWNSGPNVQEQYLSTSKTGDTLAGNLAAMAALKATYAVVFGSDIGNGACQPAMAQYARY